MLWLDAILAVPTVGIRLESNFAKAFEFQTRIAGFIDQLYKKGEPLNITETEIWGYSILASKSGFTFDINYKNIGAKFAYGMTEVPQPGALPGVEKPELRSYTKVLDTTCGFIKDILSYIKDIKEIRYNRIGIAVDGNLDEDSVPPGLTKWIQHMGKPWGNELIVANVRTTSKLASDDKHWDQCHHTIEFDQETLPKLGYKFTLDWQRVFREPVLLSFKETTLSLEACKEKAIKYFETFGEGDLKYD